MAVDLFGQKLPDPTSLDSQQTSVDRLRQRRLEREQRARESPAFRRFCDAATYALPPASKCELDFRHCGWHLERERVRRALKAANVAASRLERFDNCGGDCVVEWSATLKRHRLRANYCGDRFCVACGRARSVKFRRRLGGLIGDERPLFITLTLRNQKAPLSKMIDHLLSSFRRLRQSLFWKAHVRAGVAVVEVKRGAGGSGWHPHLHVIALGDYLPQTLLSDAWKVASRGSFIVDVQRASKTADAVSYAAKYVSKGWTSEVARVHDDLVECIIALRGRRLLITFGEWHRLDFDADVERATDWQRIGSFDQVHAAAQRCEPWAVGVMRSLRASVDEQSNAPPADDS